MVLNPSYVKRAIIKRLMKVFEKVPSVDDYHLSEIFRQKAFTEGNQEERERIMLKSSERAYLNESQRHSFESYFWLDLAALLKDKIVLDLGCFTGGRAVAWSERWQLGKIYGVDIRDIYIKAAQNFSKKKGANSEFVCAKGEHLPFEDRIFDAILSFDVFEHVQNVKQVLLECNRVLKKRGKLFAVFPSYCHPAEHHLGLVTQAPFIHYFFSGKDLTEAYNDIMDERGEEAYWYKRRHRDLEPWERLDGINGTTKRKLRHLLRHTNWKIYYEHNPPLLRGVSKKHPVLSLIRYMITPFAQLRGFEEFLSARIVYILEKS